MKPYKILVVEDEPNIINLIKISLRDPNYSVTFVDNGTEAVVKLAEEIPDLVLLDIMIPAPDGWEIYRAIRTKPKFD